MRQTIRRPPVLRLFDEVYADLFAGGGGTSTGIQMATGRSPDVAINHDREALAMHAINHPLTQHLRENVFDVDPVDACHGRPCGLAWFSPDCTFHSKARGGKPFLDRNRARRIRGLAWVAVRWAESTVKPRVIVVENVEEFEDWCPLDAHGSPIVAKRGQSFQRWKARLENAGFIVEARKLRASLYGAPTSRQRLFVIARSDGKPIIWPKATHGPGLTRFRTAAECIDFHLPVPSIFLTPKQARAWGKAHGVPSPRRPLALATQRRIARGIQRFVIDAADPFVIEAQGLVAPTLIQTSYGERDGQAPRSLNLHEPLGTIVAGGIKHSLVAAFLAKHNGGHEATGQRLLLPIDTVTTRDQKALVTSHLIKLYGTCQDGAAVDVPMPTVTANGNHIAEVRAFLVKFYGTKKDGRPLSLPLDTLTTKARFGLVTVVVHGEEYAIVDIGMRMLTPRELFRAQGFPSDYQIEQCVDLETHEPITLTKQAQTRLVGNSVPPHVAAAIISANVPHHERIV